MKSFDLHFDYFSTLGVAGSRFRDLIPGTRLFSPVRHFIR